MGPLKNHEAQAAAGSDVAQTSGAARSIALLPGADTGTKRFKYLSHAVAKAYREKNMPHEIVVERDTSGAGLPSLVYRKYDVAGTHTGYHPGPCSKRKRVRSDLEPFGPGVTLYFKFLKWAVAVFTVLSVINVPAIVLFYSGEGGYVQGVTPGSSAGTDQSSFVYALSLFSLGNLGEATTRCASGYEDEAALGIQCPAGMRIHRIEAVYGDVRGECDCPKSRTPASGVCPNAAAIGEACINTAAPSMTGYCHSTVSRPVLLPSGSRFSSGPCCASKLSYGREDFSDLDIAVQPSGCAADATHVQTVAAGLCLGQESCSLDPRRNVTHRWTPSLGFGTRCPGGSVINPRSPCASTWLEGGASSPSLDKCGRNASDVAGRTVNASSAFYARGPRLVVVAKCYSDSIRASWWAESTQPLSKQSVALTVVGFEILAVIIFGIAWAVLQAREGQAVWPKAQVTAADYTLMITTLPPHSDIKKLEGDLRAHLEAVLSSQPHIAQPDLPRVAVADINFALSDTGLIRLFTLRGALLQQVERLSKVALLAERSIELPPRPSDGPDAPPRRDAAQAERFKRTVQLITRLRVRLEELDAKIDEAEELAAAAASSHPLSRKARGKIAGIAGCCACKPQGARAVAAFVTLEDEEGVLRAREAYQTNTWGWLCQPRKLRMHGKYRLWLQRAPEPSDIRWENFSLGRWQAAARRVLSLLFIVALLMAAAYGIFTADEQKRRSGKLYPDVSCAAMTDVGNMELVVKDTFFQYFPDEKTGSTGRLGCYCKDVLATKGVEGLANVRIKDSSGHVPSSSLPSDGYNLCSDWLGSFITQNVLVSR